jgi:two-component system LytT family response regulator
MPKLNGLELASQIVQLQPQTFVVFQTAYEQYALEAFESGGMAYLLKPIDSNSVLKALQKIRNYKTQSSTKSIKKILGKYGDTIYLVNVEDIYYIKADLDEAIIKIKDKEVYVKRKIGELESLLQHENFFRVHRSYIVNVNKIKSMNSIEQSKLEIGFEGISQIITSSKEGAKEFREYLQRQSL